ncbi:hypothetical protein KCU71_g8718, partial [Aureobasidium melanogenum]
MPHGMSLELYTKREILRDGDEQVVFRIAKEAIAQEGPDFFIVHIKDHDDIFVTDGPSLALTNKLHMANIFHWFNLAPRMPVKVQVDVSSSRSADNLQHVVWAIYNHAFLLESVKKMRRKNFQIVGWSKPSFYALVHLAYAFGRITDSNRVSCNSPFTFDYVAKDFACHFAVSYIFERILKMGRQTGISIHQLATEIFDFLHSKDVANGEWDNHQDWSMKHFRYVPTPWCSTVEQRAARASFCP